MKKLFFFALAAFSLTACMDVGGALFWTGDGTYSFAQSDLELGYEVDTNKIHRFDVLSQEDTIYGLYVGDFAQIQQDTIIVYLHGNGPSMDNFWSTIGVLANTGGRHRYGVLMYDYRGYGKSTGITQDEETMQSDFDAVLQWLVDRGLTSERMVIFANSLGSLPAGPAAAGNSLLEVQKLIMETPQSSADAILQGATGLSLPATMITDYDFDLGANMADYAGDLLWLHGTADDVAPIENARQAMAEHAGNYYAEHIYEDAGHGLRFDITNEEWLRVIHEFMLK